MSEGGPLSSPTAVNKPVMTYTEFLDRSPVTGFLWTLIIGMALASLLDGFDFQATAFALPGVVRAFHLGPAQAGGIQSVGNFGFAFGAIFINVLCDRKGRRAMFQWVLLCYAFGAFVSAIAPNYHVLLVGRLISGLGIGAQLPIVFSILAEFSPLKLRHLLVPMSPMCYALGYVVVALCAVWLIPLYGWRAIYWAGIAPAFMAIYVRMYIPESVRYLLSKGRIEEAGRITKDLAKRAGLDVELIPPPETKKVKVGASEQFKVLRPLLGMTAAVSFFNLCYYVQSAGVFIWLPTIFVRQGFKLTTSFRYTLLVFCFTPLAQVLGAFMQGKMDRKWALFVMTVVGQIFFLTFGLSFQYHWPVWVLVGSQMAQTLFTQGTVAILMTIASEMFPTSGRTLGVGVVTGVGRCGAIMGPLVLGFLFKFGTAISQIIYYFAVPLLVACILVVLTVKIDLRKKSLEAINQESQQAAGARA